mmetsp:Transcript_72526/g.161159  ORF Transcript_72526/g.161159 Transcript_72526/m.161159 type:complete len:257 (+) Transcript_72526:2049-2819(+)
MGSLYLQKKTLISCARMLGRFCTIRLMLRSATYWISGSEERRVTRGGAIFLYRALSASWDVIRSMYLIMTLTADSTTAEFACWRRGVTRSIIDSASRLSFGMYSASESRMKTWPHSVHSFSAANIFCSVAVLIWNTCCPISDVSAISARDATAFDTTIGLESPSKSYTMSRNPWSSTSSPLMSYNFATHTAAVLRTYGSSSFRHFRRGSHKYSTILSTRMQPIVRTASARMSGLGSCVSLTNVFTARIARSGWLFA